MSDIPEDEIERLSAFTTHQNTTETMTDDKQQDNSGASAGVTGYAYHMDSSVPSPPEMTLTPGRYHNRSQPEFEGAFIDVVDVQLPGSPTYDGGMPGVSIRWGNQPAFIAAQSADHFWSKWPFSNFRPPQWQNA